MAGHSKFKNIMHRKGAQDKKRAKLFSKLAREITVAAKLGGGDPDMNPRLRLAIATAKSNSVPKDNIEKAVQKGVGGGEGDDYVEMRYEGYGPGGVAIIIDALTDNKNRTAGEVRACFSKNGGNLGESNSVSFMFDRIGEIAYPLDKGDFDTMFENAVEAGASDCEEQDEEYVISCEPDEFAAVRDTLEEKLGEPARGALVWRPNVMADIDEEQARTLLKLIDALEDDDDVQTVTTNFNVSDEILEKIMSE